MESGHLLTRASGRALSVTLLLALFGGLTAPASANVISVGVEPTGGSVKITIVDSNKGDGDKSVDVRDKNGGSLGPPGLKVGANGSVTPFTITADSLADITIEINDQTFSKHATGKKKGVTTYSWMTKAEADSNENKGAKKFNLNNTPFDDHSSVFFQPGTLDAQFMLVNTSVGTAYDISSVHIFTGLDKTFFTQGQFDSGPAAASGTLFYDSNAEGQSLTIGADDGTPGNQLAFAIGQVNPARYSLLAGVASPILANGGLGAPTDFSIGIAFIPEPSSLLVFGFGAGMLGLSRLRHRPPGRRPPAAAPAA